MFIVWPLACVLVSVLTEDPSSHLFPTYGEDLLPSYSEQQQVTLLSKREAVKIERSVEFSTIGLVDLLPPPSYKVWNNSTISVFYCDGFPDISQ